ncbi:ABC transporter permease [Lysinibacillus sp. NPDC097231]|uniref:ABC transporter permease n=1 Tax=Lysinibacillus sp. NPDC097231 TaxID=3364142 RepID=UPI0038291490
MIKLIVLELRRNKISTFLITSLIIAVVVLGFTFLFGYGPQIEASRGVMPNDTAFEIFMTWKGCIPLIGTLFLVSFAVMSAIMNAKFTVEEYDGKKAILLFSYPVKRSRILFAKCILVFGFTSLAMFICNIAMVSFFGLISNAVGILPETFTTSEFLYLLKFSVVLSLLASSVGLVAMRIGFIKKSLSASIVSAIIMVGPCGSLFSKFPDHSFSMMLIGMVILLVIGLIVFLELLTKVNKMEAV